MWSARAGRHDVQVVGNWRAGRTQQWRCFPVLTRVAPLTIPGGALSPSEQRKIFRRAAVQSTSSPDRAELSIRDYEIIGNHHGQRKGPFFGRVLDRLFFLTATGSGTARGCPRGPDGSMGSTPDVALS